LRHIAKQYTQDNQTGTHPLCVFIAVFDMGDTGELRYASIGSCAHPLLISGDETLELPVDNPCLATDNEADTLPAYQEHSFTVVPGTTFFFSTNGLFRQGIGQASYEHRLQQICMEHYHLPPELINRAIAADFADFNNKSPLEEDIAYVIVQVPKKEQQLSFKVESDIEHISKAKEKAASFLATHFEQQLDLLNFHELLANAIEHGNKRDGGKKVSVDITVTDRYWKIIITDQGEGFDWRDRINRELDLSGDSDRGRGIIITKMISDYLGYNKRGNKVTMINLR
jgi:anti-sigma regulatory factor (Ser/Thr protein kinase)